jgi:hypothetical protein
MERDIQEQEKWNMTTRQHEEGKPCADMRGIRVEDKTGKDIRPLLGCTCGRGVHLV